MSDPVHILYALAKQIPDMRRGCRIETNYGDIDLEPEEADQVADVIERLFERKLEAQANTQTQQVSE